MVRAPAKKGGEQLDVLEVGAGPKKTILGLPEEPVVKTAAYR